MAVCGRQRLNLKNLLLESGPAEADREVAKELRAETFAELFAAQAEIFYRVSGQLFQIKEIRNQKVSKF